MDWLVGDLADQQHGVVARWQLAELGLPLDQIEYRVKCGRLRLVHRGVYAVGRRKLDRRGEWMAAVLACGTGAVLSHRSAARLWGLEVAETRGIEITVPSWRLGSGKLRCHTSVIRGDELAVHDSIPVTGLHRTFVDIASTLGPGRLVDLLDDAEALRLTDSVSLPALINRHRGKRGIARLRIAVSYGDEPAFTRNRLERRFLRVLRESGLPRPLFNHLISLPDRVVEVDAAWPDRRVIVELDGRSTHARRRAFESDRERDRLLAVHGWRVIRITWRQLHQQRAEVIRDLRRLLT